MNPVEIPEIGPALQPDLYMPPEVIPDLDRLVTEDGKPVDNLYVERQHCLLTEPLLSSWNGPGESGPFLVMANVGWFHTYGEPPLVPDVMLILDVQPVAPPLQKEGRSYFQWLYGKPPDLAIEVVSDKRGGEEDRKMQTYARMRLQYYVLHDPLQILGTEVVRAFELVGKRYRPIEARWLPDIGLGLTLWQGHYQQFDQTWLRWCDQQGRLIPTGAERADQERERADQERERADQAEDRLRRLEAQLRTLGAKPEA